MVGESTCKVEHGCVIALSPTATSGPARAPRPPAGRAHPGAL